MWFIACDVIGFQGYEIGGQRVLLRYPNNTGAPGTENAPIRKPAAPVSQPAPERQVRYVWENLGD